MQKIKKFLKTSTLYSIWLCQLKVWLRRKNVNFSLTSLIVIFVFKLHSYSTKHKGIRSKYLKLSNSLDKPNFVNYVRDKCTLLGSTENFVQFPLERFALLVKFNITWLKCNFYRQPDLYSRKLQFLLKISMSSAWSTYNMCVHG